jgi:hypothetical protein
MHSYRPMRDDITLRESATARSIGFGTVGSQLRIRRSCQRRWLSAGAKPARHRDKAATTDCWPQCATEMPVALRLFFDTMRYVQVISYARWIAGVVEGVLLAWIRRTLVPPQPRPDEPACSMQAGHAARAGAYR